MKHLSPSTMGRVCIALACMILSLTVSAQTVMGRQNVDQYPTTAWGTLTYGLTWLPTDYNSTTTTYPLIIFLHGSGEGGDGVSGLNNLLIYGLPNRIANGWNPEAVNPNTGQNTKFIVVSPQAPSAAHWSYAWGSIQWILKDVMTRYRIDPTRIYVTGISAGGAGSWSCVTNGIDAAQKFAAIVPVSAAGTNSQAEADQLPLVGGTYGAKVWSITGANDAWLAFATNATNTINNASPAPQVPAKLNTIPNAGHEPAAWNTPYDPNWRSNGLSIYEWMLKYTRGSNQGNLPVNIPPTVNAGTSQTITLPNNPSLNGSASDVDGVVSSYQWSEVSGPNNASFTSPNAAATATSGLVAGTYVFRLKATDNGGASSTADVSVTVQNEVVNNTNNVLQISGKIEAENYTAMSGIQTEVTSDNLGGGRNVGWQENGDWMDYTVNVASTGNYNVAFRVATVNTGVQFQMRKSDGTILTTVTVPNTGWWQTFQTINAQVALTAGQQTIRIYTSDAKGSGWNFNWMDFSLALSNQAPSVIAGQNQTITLPSNNVTLSGTATDADGSIASYQWSQVSGPNTASFGAANAASTSASGLVAGTYVFRLKATDNGGATATADVTITVNNSNNSTTFSPIRIEAENYASMSGIQTEVTGDNIGGGRNVGWQENNDWMDYSVNIPSAATYTLSFRVATVNTGVTFQVRNAAGTSLATVTVPNTGWWQTYQTVTAQITLPAGQQTLRIITTDAKGSGWNINWWEVTNVAGSTGNSNTANIRIEAESYTSMSGIQTETTGDNLGGDKNVGWQENNDWMDYSVNVPAAGIYNVNFRVATVNTGVTFQLRQADGTALTTVTVPNTGWWQTYQTVTAQVTLPAGQQTLRIYTTDAKTTGWNINWWEIASTSTTSARSVGTAEVSPALSVFPAEITDRFALTIDNNITGAMSVQIYNVSGQQVKQFQLNKASTGATQTYLMISDLAAGSYDLKVVMNGFTDTIKIIKK